MERTPSEHALQQLRNGVQIKGGLTKSATVQMMNHPPDLPPRIPPIRHRLNVETTWLKLTITEGKNRQVRRMTAAVGFPTLRLVRTAMSLANKNENQSLTLSGLSPGQWRWLMPNEKRYMASRCATISSQNPKRKRFTTSKYKSTQTK